MFLVARLIWNLVNPASGLLNVPTVVLVLRSLYPGCYYTGPYIPAIILIVALMLGCDIL